MVLRKNHRKRHIRGEKIPLSYPQSAVIAAAAKAAE
jgi:hypothetical protein